MSTPPQVGPTLPQPARPAPPSADPAQTLTRRIATKRFLVQHVADSLLPGFTWVDGLWQLWDRPYRQCPHDTFAGTLVIKLDP